MNDQRVKFSFKARGGVEVQKCPILIFQYVIELEKTNKMQENGRLIWFPLLEISCLKGWGLHAFV